MSKRKNYKAASRLIGASALLLLTAFSQARPANANGALNIPLISTAASSLPVEVVPADAHIHYGGRFDFSDPAGPQCEWSASYVKLEFTGTSINVRLKETSANNEYEVVVDGQITAVLAPISGTVLYNIFSSGTSGTHTISLVRRTEAFYGISQFEGFQLSSGGVMVTLPTPNGRGIEIVGDSISCGYANEAANQNQTLTNTNEDAYLAYGNVVATALGAEFGDIAWSGRKMWPDNTMPSIYDLISPTNTTPNWNFSWTPGAVIINLSTNDFGAGAPDENSWTAAYEAFITHLRTHYPNAMVYCSTSPMIASPTSTTVLTYLQKIVQDKINAGDNKVKILNIPTQDGSLGYGGDWHPSLQEDQLMAGIILGVLQTDLGWTITTPPGAPISLAATIPGNGVTLNWNAAGYSSSFTIKRSTTNGGPYTTVGTVTSQAAAYNDTSTTNGVTYYYVVSATNSAGTSPNSAQVSATPEPAPTFTSSAAANPSTVGVGSVTVITLTIKDTAAVGLTNGNVLLQITDSGNNVVASNTWSGVNFTAGQQEQFTYNWTPAATGTYSVNLGVFDAGWTTGYTWNGPATTITVTAGTGPPPAPTGLAGAAGNGQVSLSWNASTGATAYDVKRSTVSGSGYATVSSPTTTSYTNTGLTNGTAYYFVVDAKNANGASANSSQVSATPTNVSTPYGGTAWAIPGTVQSENYDAGGESIAYHDTDATNNGGQYRTAEGVDVETCTDTGTGFDVAYTAAGEWMKYTCSVASTGTYNIGFRVASTTAGNTCHLEDTNGTNITGSVSVPNTGGWQTWQTVTVNNVSLTAGSHVLKFVEDTGGYNINYMSFASSGGAPPAPTGLTGTAGNTQVTLSWTASSGATSYNVLRSTVSGSGYASVATGIATTSYTNTGLTNGTTYYFVVTATNASGTSGNSNQASATPQPAIPPAPTGVAAVASDAEIALTWNVSSGATAYDVKRSTVNGSGYATVSSPTTTSYTNTGLTDGTTYYYVVAAKNASGSSANSAQVSGVPCQYNFESGVQGWTFNAAPITGVAQSTTQAFGPTHSLAVTINGAAANATARISNPSTAAGKVVTYHVWIPAGSQLSAVQPYVMDHNWLWTGNIVPLASLTQGAWNTIQITVPANAVMPLNELGVEFRVSATWSATCYIDSISW